MFVSNFQWVSPSYLISLQWSEHYNQCQPRSPTTLSHPTSQEWLLPCRPVGRPLIKRSTGLADSNPIHGPWEYVFDALLRTVSWAHWRASCSPSPSCWEGHHLPPPRQSLYPPCSCTLKATADDPSGPGKSITKETIIKPPVSLIYKGVLFLLSLPLWAKDPREARKPWDDSVKHPANFTLKRRLQRLHGCWI